MKAYFLPVKATKKSSVIGRKYSLKPSFLYYNHIKGKIIEEFVQVHCNSYPNRNI